MISRHANSATVSVEGLGRHQINGLPLVTAGGVIKSDKGPDIGILHNYAHYGRGSTIHAPVQIEDQGLYVDTRSRKLVHKGNQVVKCEDQISQVVIHHGLPRIKMRPFTDLKWETLPHKFLTSNSLWNPAKYDDDPGDEYHNAIESLLDDPYDKAHPDFNEVGDFKHHVVTTCEYISCQSNESIGNIICHAIPGKVSTDEGSTDGSITTIESTDSIVDGDNDLGLQAYPTYFLDAHKFHPDPSDDNSFYQAFASNNTNEDDSHHTSPGPTVPGRPACTVTAKEHDYEALQPMFGWDTVNNIQKTLKKHHPVGLIACNGNSETSLSIDFPFGKCQTRGRGCCSRLHLLQHSSHQRWIYWSICSYWPYYYHCRCLWCEIIV